MNLRFIERDGVKVLQHQPIIFDRHGGAIQTDEWLDVPLVQEPRKPREWTMYRTEDRDWQICNDALGIKYTGSSPPRVEVIKVREVMPDDK